MEDLFKNLEEELKARNSKKDAKNALNRLRSTGFCEFDDKVWNTIMFTLAVHELIHEGKRSTMDLAKYVSAYLDILDVPNDIAGPLGAAIVMGMEENINDDTDFKDVLALVRAMDKTARVAMNNI